MTNLVKSFVNIGKTISDESSSVVTGATLGVVAGSLAQGDFKQTAALFAATGFMFFSGFGTDPRARPDKGGEFIVLAVAGLEALSKNPEAIGHGIPGAALMFASGFTAYGFGRVSFEDSFKKVRGDIVLKPLLASAAFAMAVSGALNVSLPQETAPVAPVQQNHHAVQSIPMDQPVLYAVNAKLG